MIALAIRVVTLLSLAKSNPLPVVPVSKKFGE